MNRFVSNIPHDFWDETQPTEIFAQDSAAGATVTLYAVPSGKTAWITGLTVGISQYAAATYYGYINVFDSTPALRGRWLFNGNIQQSYDFHIPFSVPLKLASSEYITLWTNNANFLIRATLLGYYL